MKVRWDVRTVVYPTEFGRWTSNIECLNCKWRLTSTMTRGRWVAGNRELGAIALTIYFIPSISSSNIIPNINKFLQTPDLDVSKGSFQPIPSVPHEHARARALGTLVTNQNVVLISDSMQRDAWSCQVRCTYLLL